MGDPAGPNPRFLDQLVESGLTPGDERPVVFLCRSGQRSIGAARAATAAGLGPSYNVLEGFEGAQGFSACGTSKAGRSAGCPPRRSTRPPGERGRARERARRLRPQAPARERPPATLAVRGGHARTEFQETSEALFLTQGYTYDRAADAEAAFQGELDRFVYSRYGNPTVHTFEERLRLLEGAEACYATASGMSAVFTALAALVRSGSRIVAARALFGSSLVIFDEIFAKWGVRTDYVDGHVLSQWEEALSTPADVVFFETPSNPMQDIVDARRVSELAHAAGAVVVLDNVFATPLLQRPLELGADVVVYSATKHIDGQGRVLGGAILGTEEFVTGPVQTFIRNTGPSLSAFNAWVLLKGLETLPVRVAAQNAAAAQVAEALEQLPGIGRVRYPFLASHPQRELARSQQSGGGRS